MKFYFENLQVYQLALLFSKSIFEITSSWSIRYQSSLGDQIRRAALSISLNIAEGSSRTQKDYQHFLTIARGSCYECIPILTLAKQMNLIVESKYTELSDILDHTAKMLTALRNTIQRNNKIMK